MKIRFLTLDEKMSGILQDRIDRLEARYEMVSSDMAIALANGSERETAEKLKWMFDYHVLEYLREQIPMNGTPGTTTSPSTRRVSEVIPS